MITNRKRNTLGMKVLSLLISGILLLVAACSSSTITTTIVSTTVSTTSTTSSATTPGNLTAAQLVDSGKTVFANSCAACHGTNGQGITGPVLIGQYQTLDKYNNAQGLLRFIDTTMPLNAPASLSSQQYLQVLSYLLLQNNFVSGATVIDPSNLASISLK